MQLSRIIAFLAVSGALTVGASADAAPTVIITIDVESNSSIDLPKQVDTICQDGSACGLMEIVRMLRRRQIAGTFFLNVYEYSNWGNGKMRDIVEKLQAAGQDVALHTHPQWAYDSSRNGMRQYSIEEQTSIIRDGVKLLSAWSGRPVVAHRAGDYAADERTLMALAANGLSVDSSLFWGHPHSQLTELGLPRNLPSSFGKVLEIPVTIYERRERPPLFGGIVPPLSSIRKVDAGWLLDEEEAKATIDAVVQSDLPFLVVFLHSFTFVAGRTSDGVPAANRQAHNVFSAILDRLVEQHLKVITMREAATEKEVISANPGADVVPVVNVRVSPQRYLWHAFRTGNASVLVATGAALISLFALVALGLARIRNRKPG